MEPFVNNYFGLLRFLKGSIRDEWPAALFSILQGSRQVMYFEIEILRIYVFHHERKVPIHLLLIELMIKATKISTRSVQFPDHSTFIKKSRTALLNSSGFSRAIK